MVAPIAGEAVEAASVAIGVEPEISSWEAFIEGGKKGAETFTENFNKAIEGKLVVDAAKMFSAGYSMFKDIGEKGAEDLVEGFNAILRANPETDFEFASGLFKQVEDGAADMVTSVVSKIPLIGQSMTAAFNEGKEAVDGFLGLGQEWLESITEIGNAYIEVGRTIAATSAGENLEQLTNATREIMATGANVFLDDVSHSIGRLNDNIHNLSMDQLKELTTTFSQAEELVGKFSPTMFAGVINAYDLGGEKANETLTHLVNISRITGESMGAMMGEMTRVGPAMRNLGYDAEQTGMFFGQMVEYGERGTRLIYGMNEVAAKLNKQIVEGKAVGFSTTEEGFAKLIESVKELHRLGEDDKAKSLLGQFTTPSTAPLLFELIQKGVLDAANMRKELEGINNPLVEALDETKSIDDALRLISEQVKANLEPIGGVIAHGLVAGGTQITEWLAENQSKLIGWADTITETVLTVFGKVAQGVADTLQVLGPALDVIKGMVIGSLDAILEPLSWVLKGLSALPDALGGKAFNDALGGVNAGIGLLKNLGEVDISHGLDVFDDKITNITQKGIPNLNANIHKTAEEFKAAAEISEAFKEKIGGENKAAVEIEKEKGGGFPENPYEAGVLHLQGTIDQQRDVAKKLEEIGIMIDAGTDGVVKRITFKTDEAKKTYDEWYAAQTKKSDKLEVPIQPTKDGEPVNSAQEALPDDGTAVGVEAGGAGGGGGAPPVFAPLPTALPYSPGNLNLPSGLGGASRPDLTAALLAKGFSPEQVQAIQGFSKVEGLNPSGNPTLGFMDSQLGGDTSLLGHVSALAKQFQDRAAVAGPFPTGGSALDKANWLATVVGQNGSSSGPDGLPQPSRSNYVNRVAGAMGGEGVPSGMPSGGGDAGILANVPAGRYLQTQAADLQKGIGDCSSAVEDLINMMDGSATAGRQMATGNAAQWLSARGFQINTTGANIPGAFNVGFNDHHMQATLPGGTNFNWGSDDAAEHHGIGGTGAFDPAFTQHYYRMGSGNPGGPVSAPGGGGGGGTPTGVPVFVTNWPGGGGGFGGGGGGGGGGAGGGEGGGLPSGLPADGGPEGPRGPLPGPGGGDGGLYSPENTNPGLNNPPVPGGAEGGHGGGEGGGEGGPPSGSVVPDGHVNTIQIKLASSDTDINPLHALGDALQTALFVQRAQALLSGTGPSVGGAAPPYMDDNGRWRSAQTGRFTKEPPTGVQALVEKVSGTAGELSAKLSATVEEVASNFAPVAARVSAVVTPVAEEIARSVESIVDDASKALDSAKVGVTDAAKVVSERAAAASAEVGAAGAEFSAGMEPVVEQLGQDLKGAWAQYVEDYSKTAMGGLLRYIRDQTVRLASTVAQQAKYVAENAVDAVKALDEVARSVASDAADMGRSAIQFGRNVGESVATVARTIGGAMDDAGEAFMQVARSVGQDAIEMAQAVRAPIIRATEAVKEPVVRAAQGAADLGRQLASNARDASEAFLQVARSVGADAADMARATAEFIRPIAAGVAQFAKDYVGYWKYLGQTAQYYALTAADEVRFQAAMMASNMGDAARAFNQIARSVGVDAMEMAQTAARFAGTLGEHVAQAAVGIRDAVRGAPAVRLMENVGRAGIDAARSSFPVIDQLATRVGSWGPQIAEHVRNFAAPLNAGTKSIDVVGANMIPQTKTILDHVTDATHAVGNWATNAARGVADFAEPLLTTIRDSKIVQVMGDAAKFGGRALAAVNRFDPLGIGLSAAIEAIDPYQRKDQVVKYDDGSGHVIKDQLSQQFGGSAIPDHIMSAVAGHQFTDWWQRASYEGSADQKADTDVSRARNDQLGVTTTNQGVVNYNRAHPTPLVPGQQAPATVLPAPGVSLPIPTGLSLQALQNLQSNPANAHWDAYRKHLIGLGYTGVPDAAPTGKYYDWTGTGAPGFALGGSTAGLLPGYGGGDKIPILAEGGEFVFNKESAAFWADLLPWMNAKKFQPGGSVGGSGGGGSEYLLQELQRQSELDNAAHEFQTKAAADPDIQAAVAPLKAAMDAATALLVPLQAAYDKESDFEKSNDQTYTAQYAKTKQAIDAYNAAVTKAGASTWDLHQAQVKMAEQQLKPDPKVKGESNKDAEALGKGFVKGLFQELGFGDGADAVFGKPFTEWGISKLAMGGLGYGMNLMQHAGEMGPIGPQNVRPETLSLLPDGMGGGGGGGGLFNGLLNGVMPGLGQQGGPGSGLPGDPSLMTPALAASGNADGGPMGPRGPAPGPAGPQDNRTYNNTTNNLAPQPLLTPPSSAGQRAS